MKIRQEMRSAQSIRNSRSRSVTSRLQRRSGDGAGAILMLLVALLVNNIQNIGDIPGSGYEKMKSKH